MRPRSSNTLRDESGMALIIAVLILVVVSAIGLASIDHAGAEAQESGAARRTMITFHAADAGIQFGISRLVQDPPDLTAYDITLSNGARFRSGARTASSAQQLPTPESGPPPDGYALNTGGGYLTQTFTAPVTAFGVGNSVAELEVRLGKLQAGVGGY